MFQVQTPCGITMANTVRKGRLCLLAHNLTLTLAYGVDWEALSDSRVMRHHAVNNPRAGESTALEVRTHERPRELSIVRCEPPESPLSEERKLELSESLRDFAEGLAPRSAPARLLLWSQVLSIFNDLRSVDEGWGG